jgi:predicted glycosyltransferase
VDKEPRGAVGELGPALRALRARGRTRCVLGLRDVLDDPATVRREWAAAGNEEAIREHYQAVWVYGDPTVYDPVREYRFRPEVTAKVAYTGYLDPAARTRAGPPATCGDGRPTSPGRSRRTRCRGSWHQWTWPWRRTRSASASTSRR